MIKCKICGKEYKALGIHLKFTHKISVTEYLDIYPNSPTLSEESKKAYGDAKKKNWQDPDFRKFQLERLNSYSNSEENKERLREHNRDKNFIDSQRNRLSKLASDTNRRMWQEDYDTCRERATKNALWAARTSCITKPQKEVADYLRESNVNYSLEKYFIIDSNTRVRVDIYLEDYDLIIEINGNYWHGKPDSCLEDMTYYQRQGYERDRVKESIFGDKLLFLWEDEIWSGEYKLKLDEFIGTRGHVKSGELLET